MRIKEEQGCLNIMTQQNLKRTNNRQSMYDALNEGLDSRMIQRNIMTNPSSTKYSSSNTSILIKDNPQQQRFKKESKEIIIDEYGAALEKPEIRRDLKSRGQPGLAMNNFFESSHSNNQYIHSAPMGSMIGGGNTKIILDSKSSKLPRNLLSSAF